MQTTAAPTMLRHLWIYTVVSGLLAVLLGVLIFLRPGAAIIVTAIFFGAYLLVTGVAQIVLAFSVRSSFGGRALLFVSGAAALVLAVLCFVNFSNSIDLLAIWIGVGFVFRGVATAMSAFSDQSLPGRIWEIVVGVISVLAGIIMFVAPLEGLVALTQVTGIILVVIGVVEVIAGIRIRRESSSVSGHTTRDAVT
ncbi:HdeD family acid-resistance protein [Mycolicibacterium litorale]|nr:HdeD family acid-resistance protein [Mycolicibacterium litorale]